MRHIRRAQGQEDRLALAEDDILRCEALHARGLCKGHVRIRSRVGDRARDDPSEVRGLGPLVAGAIGAGMKVADYSLTGGFYRVQDRPVYL